MTDRNECAAGNMPNPAPGIETAGLLAAGDELSRVVQEACEKGMVDADGVSWLTERLWAWERAKGIARPGGAASDILAECQPPVSAAPQPAHAITVRPLEWVPGFCDEGPCFKASEYGEPGKAYLAFDEEGKAWHEAQRRARILAQTTAAPQSTDHDAQVGERMTEAARDILAERRRQVSAEGWTPEHDDAHANGELAAAGGLYAFMAEASPSAVEPPPGWPWEKSWWKPKDPRADLVRAGALILAEIERLDRAAAAGKPS